MVKIEEPLMSATVSASIKSLSGTYQSAALNWPVHDQSNSVTSAGAVPASSAVTSFGRMSSHASVCKSTWMPVAFSNSAATSAPCGEGISTVIDLPASGLESSALAGTTKASAASAAVDNKNARIIL